MDTCEMSWNSTGQRKVWVSKFTKTQSYLRKQPNFFVHYWKWGVGFSAFYEKVLPLLFLMHLLRFKMWSSRGNLLPDQGLRHQFLEDVSEDTIVVCCYYFLCVFSEVFRKKLTIIKLLLLPLVPESTTKCWRSLCGILQEIYCNLLILLSNFQFWSVFFCPSTSKVSFKPRRSISTHVPWNSWQVRSFSQQEFLLTHCSRCSHFPFLWQVL